jgi:hypothetical protein
MITIHTFSPATGEITSHGPYDTVEMLERFLSNKIRQFLRVKSLRKAERDVLFSFGVLPPPKERNGTFRPAGVVYMKDGMPEILKIQRFVGTLQSLAEPATFKRYIRHDNGPK